MKITVGSEIRVREAPEGLQEWCREELVIPNPEYQNRARRGLWLGKTPKYLWLYWVDGEDLMLPVGAGRKIREYMTPEDTVKSDLADNGEVRMPADTQPVPLYDYQEGAVDAMRRVSCGILKSPCGSGKTQMGIALIASLRRRALWITHTQDLLRQSYDRAAQYLPREMLGTITGGKVQLGSFVTFATVQTLSRLDLAQYRYLWDVIVVDECHRLAGTPAQMTMFYKVINSLAARRKYGLSATVHRADGMIKSTFLALGNVVYEVPEEAVADKTMQVRILRRDTGIKASERILDTDGTLEYGKLMGYLTENQERNALIVRDLVQNREHYNLILSDRLEHLRGLMEALPEELRSVAAMIDGHMTSRTARAARELAIENLRAGQKHYLFASYSLAKEGLDIPRLDRLYLTTPKKDYAVVTQSVGRIARKAENKTDAVCYDYVDEIGFCENQYKRRRTHYRKAGCAL